MIRVNSHNKVQIRLVWKPKVKIFIALSLDGFMSRTNGSLDWLDKSNFKVI